MSQNSEDTATQPRAVSVALQKGGVGKTTLAINIAERLHERGHRVLLVDLDQQGNATEGVGLRDAYDAETHLGDVFGDDATATLNDIIRETEWFDVIPANRDFDALEDRIRTTTFAETWVRKHVVEAVLGDRYDYVVIDSPPNLGALSDASLIASQNVIVPLQMSEPSISGLERMVEDQIAPLRQQLDINILALVPNRLEGDNEERRIITDIETSPFAENLPAFGRSDHFDNPDSPGPGIRKRIAFRRAWREGKPVAAYDSECDQLERLDELAAIVERGGIDA
ncbi:ParA family protein [Haloplanus salilacus]|uniref:ParA family protein n=1 Tax=Haloplanus salilacus TaxID=2949994 RepID=UPI0030CDF078